MQRKRFHITRAVQVQKHMIIRKFLLHREFSPRNLNTWVVNVHLGQNRTRKFLFQGREGDEIPNQYQ